MMERASTSETSVNFYQATRRNKSEDSHLHTRCRENLKSELKRLFYRGQLQCWGQSSLFIDLTSWPEKKEDEGENKLWLVYSIKIKYHRLEEGKYKR
jgi:hypothetical protein